MATIHEKMKLLNGFMNGEIANRGPFNLTVDVSRLCNLRCRGCRYHSSGVNIPSLRAFRVFWMFLSINLHADAMI
jgi:hypothetical protein